MDMNTTIKIIHNTMKTPKEVDIILHLICSFPSSL